MTALCGKPFQGYAKNAKTALDETHGWHYCTSSAGHVPEWSHEADHAINSARPVLSLGEDCPIGQGLEVAVDVWATVLVDGKDVGLVDRRCGRPLREISNDLVARCLAEDPDLFDESTPHPMGVQLPSRVFPVEVFKSFKGTWQIRWQPPLASAPIYEDVPDRESGERKAERIRNLYAECPLALKVLPKKAGAYSADYEWPDHVRWIAVYPVTGGSEGHYIHVDVVRDVPTALGTIRTTEIIFLCKTFRGKEHAQRIASLISKYLPI